MESTSLPSDDWNNVTASSSVDDDLTQYVAHISNPVIKIIYILIGTVGIVDNLFVIVVFALFIKITGKVSTILSIILNNVTILLLVCLSTILHSVLW